MTTVTSGITCGFPGCKRPVHRTPKALGYPVCSGHSQQLQRGAELTPLRKIKTKAERIDWPSVLEHGAEIVRSYDTGVTLRQLWYRLVADGTLPNVQREYSALSSYTTDARRWGDFPALVDRRRSISRPFHFDGLDDAKTWLSERYRLDRTKGQKIALYVGCEKDALSALLEDWLNEYGIPVLIFGGQASEGYEREIDDDLGADGRESLLLYLGDLDPAGEQIQDHINEFTMFDEVVRIGLTKEQADGWGLAENTDPDVASKLTRHPGRNPFMAKYGRLFQIEVDAIEPDRLQRVVLDAVGYYWDRSEYNAVLTQEKRDRKALS
jgi:hypothetical protein